MNDYMRSMNPEGANVRGYPWKPEAWERNPKTGSNSIFWNKS
jgi:hypothetical protein